MSDLIAELRACGTDLAEAAANEIERCHVRLEIDHCFRMGPEPDLEMIRQSVPFEKRAEFPDAVRCRDATIAAIEEDITGLRALTAELVEALERITKNATPRGAIGFLVSTDDLSHADAVLSRARAKEDT